MTIEECTPKELKRLESVYKRDIYPVLTPLAIGAGQPFPYISGLSLSLGVLAVDPDSSEERFARVKVPEGLDRFVDAGTRVVPLEAVIAHFLPSLFPGMEISERVLFRVTRDADFEVSDDADDLLEAVEEELRRRRFGDVIRVEVSASASAGMLTRLQEGLAVDEDQVYEIEGLLDLADLMQLTRLDRPDLKPEPWVPVTQPRLARAKDAGRLFDEIRRADILVHQPYESFRTSFEAFAAAAADDPDVIAMKTAVYRTSDDSTLISALVDCAEDGKQAVCLVELKARFDERRNIEWSRELEQAGVHVVHGFPDMKIHAKMTLVVRREAGGLRRYVHIGTGNYHASTARLYEDVGIFTADEEIAADVADVFNYVTGFGRPQRFRKLLVAPFEMRTRLVEEIRAVGAAAKAGETARIRLKLNNLVDPTIIDELYAASNAGASIDICARSICMLRPGVEGLSENIRVRSIVGRFLEHSRIYSFEAGDRISMFIGSADLMPRNLDRRVEVLTPDRERTLTAGAPGHPRQRLRRRRPRLDPRERRLVVAGGAAEAGQADRPPGGDDASRAAAGATAERRQQRQEPVGRSAGRSFACPGRRAKWARCASRSSMSDPIRRAFSSRRSLPTAPSCRSPRSATTCGSAPRSSGPAPSAPRRSPPRLPPAAPLPAERQPWASSAPP